MNMKEALGRLNFSDSQKKMLKMLGIFIGGMILLIVLISIIKSMSGGKISYEQLENVLTRAAEKYVKADPEVIEDEVYGTTRIDADTLVDKKYMKPMEKYTGKNSSCSAEVLVYRNLDDYTYIPRIDCGEDYKTVSLSDKITDSNNIVSTGAGLYQQDNRYIYRGELVDNYVTFSGQLWRIISIDFEGNVKLFQTEDIGNKVWDNRYNTDAGRSSGINDFEGIEPSRLKTAILGAYNNEKIIMPIAKKIIVPREYCVGKRTLDDSSNDGSTECEVHSELMGASTVTVSDYLAASLDENCVSINSKECANYNYMAKLSTEIWSITAVADTTNKAYYISSTVRNELTSYSKRVKLVVTINGNIAYNSGTGSQSDPYIIETK